MIEKNETEIMKDWAYIEPPLLTVASVTFNHENYISESLDGILMQETDFPFEIIVHDDCSTDNTAKIIEEYAKKFPTIIKPILQKENQYSKGVKVFTFIEEKILGEYVAICEGDDYWIDPNKLQIQLDEMRKVENCNLSFHSAIVVWEDKSKKDGIISKQANSNKIFTTSEVIKGDGGFCPTVSLIYKKEIGENLPEWYSKAPFGDYFMQILGSVRGGALYIDRSMAVYRGNTPGSWSEGRSKVETREKQVKQLMKTMDEMDRYFDNKFHPEIMQIKSHWYYELARAYLQNNDFKKFNQTISKSYHMAEKKSKKLLLNFYLRNFPLLLQYMGKLNKYLVSKR